MRGRIYLLGTRHSLQCGTDEWTPEQVGRYRAYVRASCDSHGVGLLAEEMSNDALAYQGATTTVAQQVADEINVPYIALDLNGTERAALGIDDYSLGIAAAPAGTSVTDRALRKLLGEKISDPLRERCWFARILAKDIWPVLFVCGADHVANLLSLMDSVNQVVTLLHQDYAP